MKFDAQTYRLTEPGSFGKIVLAVGIVGLVLSAVGMAVDYERFYHAYLVSFAFWVSLGLGGLFFTMLHHLVGATWSVVLRRISESLMWVIPLTAVFFIPIIFGLHDLYHWTHEDAVAGDELLQWKAPWLNQGFFVVRTVIYFAIWTFLAWLLWKNSMKEDEGYREEYVRRMRKVSAVGMVIFALSVTAAGFDWLMSLDPHWYSTIFGVYYFSGGLLGVIALITVISVSLRSQNVLKDQITREHYHDLGKLMFAFTIFWSYVAFSQYFLQWYGNIPEETVWYLHRWEGSWKAVSLVIVFGHFALPFVVLLFQNVKRNLNFMRALAIWMLLMHWVDMYWLVLPTYHGAEHGAPLSWMDVATMVGLGGLFIWYFWRNLSSHPLVPVNDPRLEKSIRFVNM